MKNVPLSEVTVVRIHAAGITRTGIPASRTLLFGFRTAVSTIAQPRQGKCHALFCFLARADRRIDLTHLIPQLLRDDRLMIMFDDDPIGLVLANDLVILVAYRSGAHLSEVSDIDLIPQDTLDSDHTPQVVGVAR